MTVLNQEICAHEHAIHSKVSIEMSRLTIVFTGGRTCQIVSFVMYCAYLLVSFKISFSQAWNTPDRHHFKTLILSTNVDRKSLETEFSLAICRLAGDKWQSKTLFPVIFDPRGLFLTDPDLDDRKLQPSMKTDALQSL